jgi:hypothetical protein
MRSVHQSVAALVTVLLASHGADATARQLRGGTNPSNSCSNLDAVFADVNQKCCNGGSDAGHRRLQGNTNGPSPTCVLSTCTRACAEVFVSLMENCQPDMPVTGSGFSILRFLRLRRCVQSI